MQLRNAAYKVESEFQKQNGNVRIGSISKQSLR